MASDRNRTAVLGAALALSATLTAVVALAAARPDAATARTIAVGAFPLAVVLEPRTGRAFVANDGDGSISVLDLSGPHPLVQRTVHLGGATAFVPLALALDAGAHHLFVASGTTGVAASVVYMLDSRSGARRATVRVGQEATAVAVDGRRGHVFVTTAGDSSVSLLDAHSGAVLRTLRLGLAPLALAVDARTDRVFIAGAALLPSQEVAGGQAGLVGVLDTRTGAVLRTVVVGHGPAALAVDARTDRVFVANSDDDTVSVLDARSGVLLRTVAVGWAPAALAVDARQGRVFVINGTEGTLSVLNARTGTLRRTVAVFPATASLVTWPYALAVDEARARVYVTAWGQLDQAGLPTGSGQLAVLDAHSGRRLRTVAAGVAPRAVAVEAGSGRVVVVNSGGAIRAPQGWLERWRRSAARWAPWLGQIVPRGPDVSVVPGSVQVIDPPPGRDPS